ncbi:MAG: hypothetical protein HYZ28_27070 [Myxococcales bacterium]|nr:hypothetical protein [Myxococcales bacterium]
MSSITIHGLDDALASAIRAKARAERTSINRAVKRLLEEVLGVRPSGQKHRKSFERFCGMWSRAQAKEFEKAVADFEKVERADWR